MPSRYNTYNPDRKISQGSASKGSGPGASGKVNIRQSYTGCPLPGKASHGFAEAKKGYREVNGYAAYKGLSQSSTADDMKKDYQAAARANQKIEEYRTQEEAGYNVLNKAKENARAGKGYAVDPDKLGQFDTAFGYLYERKRKK
jgi:hypothetical protein